MPLFLHAQALVLFLLIEYGQCSDQRIEPVIPRTSTTTEYVTVTSQVITRTQQDITTTPQDITTMSQDVTVTSQDITTTTSLVTESSGSATTDAVRDAIGEGRFEKDESRPVGTDVIIGASIGAAVVIAAVGVTLVVLYSRGIFGGPKTGFLPVQTKVV